MFAISCKCNVHHFMLMCLMIQLCLYCRQCYLSIVFPANRKCHLFGSLSYYKDSNSVDNFRSLIVSPIFAYCKKVYALVKYQDNVTIRNTKTYSTSHLVAVYHFNKSGAYPFGIKWITL